MDEIIIDLAQTTLDEVQYNAIYQFFDKVISDTSLQDKFFENFTAISENIFFKEEHWHKAEQLLKMILKPALDWESKHPGHFIHKGTPFYYWGMAAVCRGDIDTGYALMHQALQEDIRIHNTSQPTSPAFAFASLDYENVNQAFRDWSLYQVDFLEKILKIYCSSYGKNLTVGDFRTRFLLHPPNLDIVFLFTYTLGRFFLLDKVPDYALKNNFVSQLEIILLFNLVLIIDTAIKVHNSTQNSFSMHATFLVQQGDLGLNQNKIQSELNSAYQSNFDLTLSDILEGRFVFEDGSGLFNLERDLAIAFGLRNYWAHNIFSVSTVWQRFLGIRQSLFNILFFTIETLY